MTAMATPPAPSYTHGTIPAETHCTQGNIKLQIGTCTQYIKSDSDSPAQLVLEQLGGPLGTHR